MLVGKCALTVVCTDGRLMARSALVEHHGGRGAQERLPALGRFVALLGLKGAWRIARRHLASRFVVKQMPSTTTKAARVREWRQERRRTRGRRQRCRAPGRKSKLDSEF